MSTTEEQQAATHTPGPWEYDWYDGHISLMSNTHPEDYFARIEFSDCVESGEWDGESAPTEEIANARLIAAAPELFLQCQRALGLIGALRKDHPDADQYLSNVMSDLSAAIAKAEGR